MNTEPAELLKEDTEKTMARMLLLYLVAATTTLTAAEALQCYTCGECSDQRNFWKTEECAPDQDACSSFTIRNSAYKRCTESKYCSPSTLRSATNWMKGLVEGQDEQQREEALKKDLLGIQDDQKRTDTLEDDQIIADAFKGLLGLGDDQQIADKLKGMLGLKDDQQITDTIKGLIGVDDDQQIADTLRGLMGVEDDQQITDKLKELLGVENDKQIMDKIKGMLGVEDDHPISDIMKGFVDGVKDMFGSNKKNLTGGMFSIDDCCYEDLCNAHEPSPASEILPSISFTLWMALVVCLSF